MLTYKVMIDRGTDILDLQKGERMKKLNCWEVKKCGRQPGGHSAHTLGICPVTTEVRLHGTHGGDNAGRACWVVAGTLCGGRVQGTYAQKFQNCTECDFYSRIRKEEGLRFELAAVLLPKVRDKGPRRKRIGSRESAGIS